MFKTLNIDVVLPLANTHRIYIYNQIGERLYDKALNSANIELSVEKLLPGVYFLEIIDGKSKYIEKFIKL